MSELKKYRIVVRYFNEKTREVELTATLRTVATTKDRAIALANLEVQKSTSPACWEIK